MRAHGAQPDVARSLVMASADVAELARRLSQVPLFDGLQADVLERIVAVAHARKADAGQFFFHEGDAADEFLVLIGGRVKMTQLAADGHQVVLRLSGPGEAFGGIGAFGDATYPISAEAVEPSTALAWSSTTMHELLRTHSVIALNALRFVSGRLHDLQSRYRQLMTERVERRVARAVLRLVQEAGKRVASGIEIDFPVSRQDIAEMTGTTLYTVSRLLGSWEERGIVQSGRQRIVLTKPDALLAIAEDIPER